MHISENILLENHNDPEGDSMRITDLEKPAHGRLRFSEDGTYTYLPKQGYSGTDTISYDVSDGMGRTSAGTVNIEIIPEPRIIAKNDNFETGKNTDLVIWTDKLLENDESLDGTSLRIIGYTKPSRGAC
ncbi:MAG: hypothetical protein GY749_30795 [Desulfobacteraceae bacterium]|nr:hypothetical protein [Desulfobacteraceae bacterium]